MIFEKEIGRFIWLTEIQLKGLSSKCGLIPHVANVSCAVGQTK